MANCLKLPKAHTKHIISEEEMHNSAPIWWDSVFCEIVTKLIRQTNIKKRTSSSTPNLAHIYL